MKDYPKIEAVDLGSVLHLMQYITKERKNDIRDFNNITNNFISGRKVGKIPSSATDIIASDKVGDFNYDANYIYICVENSGSAEWRRVAISSW